MSRYIALVLLLLVLILAACGLQGSPVAITPVSVDPFQPTATAPIESALGTLPSSQTTPADAVDPSTSPVPPPPLAPEDWKSWPIIPSISAGLSLVYLRGQSLGNDPQAFSIFGDCQSEPESFLGIYELDSNEVAALPLELQETVDYFTGSFNRLSPTVRSGTTAGALLWSAWHQNEFGCQANETPMDCELRLHRPSYVIIHVGTHWESRNITYLRRIIAGLLENGMIPILATKADNRELDERINLDMASLAVEYAIPLWNFWAATQGLPDQGLTIHADQQNMGKVYLTEEALILHRLTALQVLDAVWRAVGAD